MPKIIESPVPQFPGTVTLYDPLPWPRYKAWKAAVERASELRAAQTAAGAGPERFSPADVAGDDDLTDAMLEGICACVENWGIGDGAHLQYTPETFPASPVAGRVRLVLWLTGEINRIILGEESVPNG